MKAVKPTIPDGGTRGDDALGALVRALARQAAAEHVRGLASGTDPRSTTGG